MKNKTHSEINSTNKTIDHIKKGLHLTAQLILASPLKLPIKLIQGAKYAVLAISLIDGLFEKKEVETIKEAADEKDGA